jgi:hypothetical protein
MPQEGDIRKAVKALFGKTAEPKKPAAKAQSMPAYRPSSPPARYKRGPVGKMVPADDPPPKDPPKRMVAKR